MSSPFKKILIANRGEIAVRIARACRALSVSPLAVYSDADRGSLHTQAADAAYPLGDPKPSASYLNIPKIIDTALMVGADAIHPGYGFLSENAVFAEACEQAGLVFIGPSAKVIRQMGDKIGAKTFLEKEGIPVIPGLAKPLTDIEEVKTAAAKAGYPVLLKASAGGGGKGMRVVRQEAELVEALAGCQREAKNAFGDDRVFLEKYLENPRHVEIQIAGDHHGNVIHLFERECSIQRRHQKVIEETPSPALDDALRSRMCEAAVKIGRSIRYSSLGTIEFILDADKNFYFLEVNTRLQVEHPITEMTTGVDLVKMQIRIAAGEKLESLMGPRPVPYGTGHAIECRICAEDPEKNFMPSIGTISRYRAPAGEGIRVDSGISEGWTIPVEYDPMLSKLIVHAPTRERAIVKMIEALNDFHIGGIKTNIAFLKDVLRHPSFAAGETETGFIAKHLANWSSESSSGDIFEPWQTRMGWRLGGPLTPGPSLRLSGRGETGIRGKRRHTPEHDLTAPMPGQVTKVLVQEGDTVFNGQTLMVLEAMKMEHSIAAPREGIVKKVRYAVGDKVGMGDRLLEMA